jgi:mRNA interferase RelE/StbE
MSENKKVVKAEVVKESEIVVYVISVGKRENNKVYDALKERI